MRAKGTLWRGCAGAGHPCRTGHGRVFGLAVFERGQIIWQPARGQDHLTRGDIIETIERFGAVPTASPLRTIFGAWLTVRQAERKRFCELGNARISLGGGGRQGAQHDRIERRRNAGIDAGGAQGLACLAQRDQLSHRPGWIGHPTRAQIVEYSPDGVDIGTGTAAADAGPGAIALQQLLGRHELG